MEDMKMTVYDKDSSASAVILADFGTTTVEYDQTFGWQLKFERLTRIKILNKDGFSWADFSIPLYHENATGEKLTNLKGLTHNIENGKVVETKLKNDALFKEVVDSRNDNMKGTMPNVKVGSVIEITYRISSDFIFNLWDWQFQYQIPVRVSEYRVNIPEYFIYDRYLQGYLQPTINERKMEAKSITINSSSRSGFTSVTTDYSNDKIEFQQEAFRWVLNDIPAFKEEPYITTYKNYVSKINFELASTQFPGQPFNNIMGSWESINKTYTENSNFGGEISGNGFLKKIAEEVTTGLTSDDEKVAAIHNFVRNNFTWNGYYRKFTDTSLRSVVDSKVGTSAELNLLVASLLEKINIQVYPVLISTRNHGIVRENISVSSQFNYCVALAIVGDKSYLLDATEKLLPTGFLPERCLNGRGLLVSKAGYRWVPLTAPIRSKSMVNLDLALSNEGGVNGTLSLERTGYFAERDRRKYFAKEEKAYVNEFAEQLQFELTNSTFTNTKALDAAFKETHNISKPDWSIQSENIIYIDPILISRINENPFRSEERKYPVDFGSPFEQSYFLKLSIPESYTVEELPQAKVIALPNGGGRFTYSASQVGNVISLVNNLQIARNTFSPEEYKNLREFYSQLAAKQVEQIVLKRK